MLRLAIACDADGQPNRFICEKLFQHVWCTGLDAADPDRLRQLNAQLTPGRDPGSPQVKQALQAHADEAIAQGVFGVPSFIVDGRLFWGQDALPMLRAYLSGDAWFDGPDWQAPAQCLPGIRR